jgi:DNA-binding SARP family transcriptional activator/tetratricopeptide (TPR) repeat protein
MRFGVLGPVEVWDGPRRLALGGPQQRELLAVLLLNANRVVSVDRLVEHLWGTEPPATARALLQGCVAGLRRALRNAEPGDQRLQTVAPGYRLRLVPGELDLDRFEELAEAAGAEPDPSRAAELMAEALGLWRGPALDGVRLTEVQAEVARLEERRLSALEQRVDLDLELGRHTTLIPELRVLVREHPFRERLWAQLMAALHRADRRAEALDAYRELRHTLVEQLGVEPGAAVRELHRTILAEPTELAPAAPVVPAQLPAGLPAFAGRAEQLKQLDELLTDPADGLPIALLTGLAGIGKTSLAVQWAHRIRDRFPDGQLYVDLRGFATGQATAPAEVVRGFLDALGVAPDRVPATLPAQANLFRSLLSRRRMLLLLDNARDSGQVRPLLPGSPGCLVLVTSRNSLAGLIASDGARPVALGPLSDADSHELLARRLGRARTGSDPAAVDRILDRCAGLPLALAVVAARAAIHPEFPLTVYAQELEEATNPLEALGDEHDPVADLRSMFSWSYRALAAAPARLFRLLALNPGPDIGVPAAASLAAVPAAEIRGTLAELVQASLLTEATPGRYRLHDLLHAYATELVATADSDAGRRAATRRIVDYYLHTAHAAYRRLHPFRLPMELAPPAAGVYPVRPTDEPAAGAWFAAELAGLVATTDRVASLGWDLDAWRLAWAFASFLEVQGRWHELASTQRTAVAAAHRLGDGVAEARSHRALGRAYVQLDAVADAEAHLRRSLDLSIRLDDRRGQAHTHRVMAMLLEEQDRVAEAVPHATRSLELHRALGNDAGQAATLSLLGWCYTRLGEHRRAVECCTEAVSGLRRSGDRPTEAHTWDSLGHAHHHLGEYAEAVACYGRAVSIFRQLGDRFDLAASLTRLGDTHAAWEDAEPARAAWREAQRIFDELEAPDAERVRARLG